MAPHRPIEYEFLDDQFNELYSAENRTGKLFYDFSLLAIGLACLGLFGLVSFTARQRTKEIGIRKVLGASVGNIISMLSGEFVRLVLLASIIAIPVAWFAMHRWLDDFAYRIELSWWMFAVSCWRCIVDCSTDRFCASHTGSRENPVKSLRTE
jgi:putative ABC transport system permease protein